MKLEISTTTWGDTDKPFYFRDPCQLRMQINAEQLPIPPAHLRMGYAVDNDASFLGGGKTTASKLRAILNSNGISMATCGAAMDWGCATGRVLRWFAEEAREIEFWGVDQDEASMTWAKENMAPPFKFLTCTSFPHLPFTDNKFGFIYALSVFTHIEILRDAWLMEMNRVMQRGGCAVFTIHDEHTVDFFSKNGRPGWIPPAIALPELANHEITIIHGEHWYETYTFFTDDYIRREWGRYFEVLDILPNCEGYQSAVILRKR